jgi:hypothetical protein
MYDNSTQRVVVESLTVELFAACEVQAMGTACFNARSWAVARAQAAHNLMHAQQKRSVLARGWFSVPDAFEV